MKKLLEICIRCGFVHRDDRTNTRQRKTHYHWKPENEEERIGEIVLHATVCHSCIAPEKKIDWQEYAQARLDTPKRHYIPESYNATLPIDIDKSKLNIEYDLFCKAILQDLSS